MSGLKKMITINYKTMVKNVEIRIKHNIINPKRSYEFNKYAFHSWHHHLLKKEGG